jgi:hypothetical protein
MNLLLLYPKPVENPKKRLSRAEIQLAGIADSVKGVLDTISGESDFNIYEFVHEYNTVDGTTDVLQDNNESLSMVMSKCDLLIDVAMTAGLNADRENYTGPVINLSPAFGGSFACNDIAIQPGGKLLLGNVQACIDESRTAFMNAQPKTHDLDPRMHYATFTPLPTRVGHAFYRSAQEHALVFLSYSEHEKTELIVEQDKKVLCEMLHANADLKSITFVVETLADGPIVEEVARSLKTALGIEPRVWGLRKGEYHDMFSVMSKSDVILFGGNSLYADAILRGFPVYPWRSRQPGSHRIAEAYTDYIDHGDRNVLLRKQREQLDLLIESQYQDATIPNQLDCFNAVLSELIWHALPTANPTADFLNGSYKNKAQSLKVIPEPRLSEQPTDRGFFPRSIWSTRNKLRKLAEDHEPYFIRANKQLSRQAFTRIR